MSFNKILFYYLSILIVASVPWQYANAQKTTRLCDTYIEENELIFKDGEELTYAAAYNWGPIFTDVGEVTLKITRQNTTPMQYHVRGDGRTYKFYDKFFMVRDIYEANFSVPHFRSVSFHRNIKEGDYTMKNTYVFDWNKNKIHARIQRQQAEEKQINLDLTTCTLDVLTYFYYLRNLDFSTAEPNQVYTVSIALDDGIYNIKCRFLGREVRKVKSFKRKVHSLKFAVEVIAGSVFKGDEKITMWISDDKNHIPLDLESPIIVGKLKGHILKAENLKHPINYAN